MKKETGRPCSHVRPRWLSSDCQQTFECECPVRIVWAADGAVKLCFVRGELRSRGRHASRMVKPVRFSTTYTFAGDDSFGYDTRFETTRPFAKGAGVLDWRMDVPVCRDGTADVQSASLELASGCRLTVAFREWAGATPQKVVRQGNRLRAVWLDRETEGFAQTDTPHGFAATVRVGR